MKLKFVYTICIVVLLAALTGNSAGPAGVGSGGYTGAPDDNPTCGMDYCHSDGDGFGSSLDMVVSDATGPVTSYIPDSLYDISFIINTDQGTPGGYGFQALSLSDAGGASVGAWLNPSDNAHVVATSNGRNYLEHHEVSVSNVFTTQWRAPAANAGAVTIYANANAVDLTGDNTGDDPTESVMLQLTESSASSTHQTALTADQVRLFPVPVQDGLSINLLGNGGFSVEIVTVAGRRVFHTSNEPGDVLTINTSNWGSGVYIIRIQNDNGEVTKKIVKE